MKKEKAFKREFMMDTEYDDEDVIPTTYEDFLRRKLYKIEE